MKKRTKLYTVLAVVLIAAVGAGSLYVLNRGAPAIAASAYTDQSAEPAEGKEPSFLPDPDNRVPGMKLVAQNNKLGLYYHPETTEVAVLNKADGHVWYSNPKDRNNDSIASPFEKEVLSSQLQVAFRDAVGNLTTYTNYAQSISVKQFTASGIDKGIRIQYTIGDMSLGIGALPKYISKARLTEKVLSKLDADTAKYVEIRYYPRDNNPEVLERLDAQVSKQLVLTKMLAAFDKAGYTPEDLTADNRENGVNGNAASSKPNFTVPIEYRLEEDSLLVTVPAGQIKESDGYQIRSIELLSYFGAAGTKDKGYMLVPDGSGSLIYLNNGKVKSETYAQRVYGDDENDNSFSRAQVAEKARLPVFGLKSGNAGFLAVIDKGEGIASISADISGKKNSYNRVSTSFALRGEDWLELYTGQTVQDIQLLTDQRYQGDIHVRYSFLSGEQAGYAGMARLYREMLVMKGELKPLEEKDSIPFYLDMLGAVDKQRSFLGVPYDAVVSMTTFDQASEIAGKLRQDGIGNLNMRYLGWFGDGISHKPPVKAEAEGKLGGKKDLLTLAGELREAGGKLYPDVAFQHIYDVGGRFSPAADAVRYVTREEAERAPYNRAFNRMFYDLGTYYLLSPAKLPYYVDSFNSSYASYGLDSLSLRDLGDRVHADYRVDRVIFRETAKTIVADQLEKLKKDYPDLMVTGGNAYAWSQASHIINMPSSSSGFNIADEEVPFMQMVLHGYMDYAGKPLNLEDEQDAAFQLLRSVELGSAPHFQWSYEPSEELKFTRYDHLFTTHYQDWYDPAVSLYREANKVLSKVRTRPITDRILHKDGVVEMKYEGGVSIIVNYTDQPVHIGGVKIDAQSFKLGGDQG